MWVVRMAYGAGTGTHNDKTCKRRGGERGGERGERREQRGELSIDWQCYATGNATGNSDWRDAHNRRDARQARCDGDGIGDATGDCLASATARATARARLGHRQRCGKRCGTLRRDGELSRAACPKKMRRQEDEVDGAARSASAEHITVSRWRWKCGKTCWGWAPYKRATS